MTMHPEYTHLTEADIAAMFVPKAKARAIILEVAKASGLKIKTLMGPSRARRATWPRQVAYEALNRAGYSTAEIGRMMGRDHTTVMHGIKAARARRAEA